MHEDDIVVSPQKYKELESELDRLTTVERRKMSERIKEARAMGDLKENFDYHDAKRQQGLLEAKIVGIKQTLQRARVAEYVGGGDTVALGSKVVVKDVDQEEDVEFTIVGVMEADPERDLISNTSPVGKGLLGHKAGDRVEVTTPGGKSTYEILEVR